MSIEKLKPSFHFEAERIEQLKQIVPEAFADGKIIWETLQEALGEFIVDDNANAEHFGLFWPGKREARKIASTPSLGTLIPCTGEGVDENTTNNIFIEGDNLEVLKLLQKSYANQIKMIYIDPPYNTGNDFIYDDNFTESIEEYLRRTGQVDEDAKPISANTKADGRFHSKWLSMMYPRLRLARNLLKDDGVIFISIGDDELHNLRFLCNEVYGEENFIEIFSWMKTETPANLSLKSKKAIEYIVCFQKNKNSAKFVGLQKKSSSDNPLIKPQNTLKVLHFKKEWIISNIKDGVFKKGIYGTEANKISLKEDLVIRDYKLVTDLVLEAKFIWLQEKLNEEIKDGTEIRIKTKTLVPSYEKKNYDPEVPWNIINRTFGVGTNDNATVEVFNLFKKKVFDFPKPTSLIEYLTQFVCEDNDIILDFFAGSSTTAHSVFNYNIKKNVNLNFILVQIPVMLNAENDTDKNAIQLGYNSIADVSFNRILKASALLKNQNPKSKFDLGVKKFALYKSNFKPWKNYNGTDIKELENLFESSSSPLVDNWKPENLLSEITLIEGFPLDSKIEVIDTYKHNKITQVSSDFCEHKLLVCLDDNIDDNSIKSLVLSDNDIFICLDNAISDKDKVTLQDKGLIKTI